MSRKHGGLDTHFFLFASPDIFVHAGSIVLRFGGAGLVCIWRAWCRMRYQNRLLAHTIDAHPSAGAAGPRRTRD